MVVCGGTLKGVADLHCKRIWCCAGCTPDEAAVLIEDGDAALGQVEQRFRGAALLRRLREPDDVEPVTVLICDPAHGGQGLPETVNLALV